MYLAYSSNMMNEPISFSDYLSGLKGNTARKQKKKKKRIEKKKGAANEYMTKKEVKSFIEKSNIELKNFTPPTQRGGI